MTDRTQEAKKIVDWMPDDVMCLYGHKKENILLDKHYIDRKVYSIEKLWQSLDLQQEVLYEIEGRGLWKNFAWTLDEIVLARGKPSNEKSAIKHDWDCMTADPETRFDAIHQTIEGCE